MLLPKVQQLLIRNKDLSDKIAKFSVDNDENTFSIMSALKASLGVATQFSLMGNGTKPSQFIPFLLQFTKLGTNGSYSNYVSSRDKVFESIWMQGDDTLATAESFQVQVKYNDLSFTGNRQKSKTTGSFGVLCFKC